MNTFYLVILGDGLPGKLRGGFDFDDAVKVALVGFAEEEGRQATDDEKECLENTGYIAGADGTKHCLVNAE